MFGWKCLAIASMLVGAISFFCGWVSWWLCNDLLCGGLWILAIVISAFGAKLWEEIKEMY